jgi:hypothetical protein
MLAISFNQAPLYKAKIGIQNAQGLLTLSSLATSKILSKSLFVKGDCGFSWAEILLCLTFLLSSASSIGLTPAYLPRFIA